MSIVTYASISSSNVSLYEVKIDVDDGGIKVEIVMVIGGEAGL